MTTWTCTSCGTVCSTTDPTCAVCATPQPQPGQDQVTAPEVPVVERQIAAPAGQGPTTPPAGQGPAAPATPPPGGHTVESTAPSPGSRTPKRALAGIAALLVVGLAVGVGAIIARSGGSSSESTVDATESTDPSQRTGGEDDLEAPVVTTTQPATTQPSPDEVEAPVVTSPPPTAPPPTTAPPTTQSSTSTFDRNYSARYVEDPEHLVRLAIPDHFTEYAAFTPSAGYGEWAGDGVTLVYEVYRNMTVDNLANRENELIYLHEVTYNPAHGDNWDADGRYVVAARAQDGHYFYERAKLRCGDMVLYRVEWYGSRVDPVADAIANRLYDDDPSLDAMGGVHPTC